VIENLGYVCRGAPEKNGTGMATLKFGTDFLGLLRVAEGKLRVSEEQGVIGEYLGDDP
jgi:hypothetical protein